MAVRAAVRRAAAALQPAAAEAVRAAVVRRAVAPAVAAVEPDAAVRRAVGSAVAASALAASAVVDRHVAPAPRAAPARHAGSGQRAVVEHQRAARRGATPFRGVALPPAADERARRPRRAVRSASRPTVPWVERRAWAAPPEPGAHSDRKAERPTVAGRCAQAPASVLGPANSTAVAYSTALAHLPAPASRCAARLEDLPARGVPPSADRTHQVVTPRSDARRRA